MPASGAILPETFVHSAFLRMIEELNGLSTLDETGGREDGELERWTGAVEGINLHLIPPSDLRSIVP